MHYDILKLSNCIVFLTVYTDRVVIQTSLVTLNVHIAKNVQLINRFNEIMALPLRAYDFLVLTDVMELNNCHVVFVVINLLK